MSAAAETVLRRVRDVVGSEGIERIDPGGVRLLLGELLFDGAGVPDWHERAACRGAPDDGIFFADDTGRNDHSAAAKAICARCPVRAACLADVMSWEQPAARFGIVGGLSPRQRQELHRTVLRTTRGGEAA